MEYDPSYFVEREQYVARMRAMIDEDFDAEMGEVFHEVINTYQHLVDMAREYETSFDEDRKKTIGEEYEKVAKLFKRYLKVMQETMGEGWPELEKAYEMQTRRKASGSQ